MKKIVATILATAIAVSPVYVSADNHSNKSTSSTSQNMMGQNTTGQNMMVQNTPQQNLTTASRGYSAVNSMASLPSISVVSPTAKWVGYGIVGAVVAGAIATATKTTSNH
jgi:hypothetical protein